MKVIAYKAELIVDGTRYNKEEEDSFYRNVKIVYAETVPTLLDEMVKISKIMLDELKLYLAQEGKSEELDSLFKQHDPSNGYIQWYFTANRPPLLNVIELNDENAYYSSGGAITNPEDIVRSMVHYRYLDIEQGVWQLRSVDSNLPEWRKDRSLYQALHSENLDEVMSAGYTGVEFQEYINDAPEALALYHRKQAQQDRFRKQVQKKRRWLRSA